MRLLTIIIFTLLTFGAFAQTGSINFSVGRSKVTDTATVTMPSGYGGMRFKNQASQTKWQFTNDGTNWFRLIGGNINNNYIPKFNSTTGMLTNSMMFDNGSGVGVGTTIVDKFNITAPSQTSVTGTGAFGGLHFVAGVNNGVGGFTINRATSDNLAQGAFLLKSNSSTGTTAHIGTTDDFGSGVKERLRIDQAGRVGMGTTSMVDRVGIGVSGTTISGTSAYGGLQFISSVDNGVGGITINRSASDVLSQGGILLKSTLASGTSIIFGTTNDFGVGFTERGRFTEAGVFQLSNTIKILGGSPTTGDFLRSTDNIGNAEWFDLGNGGTNRLAWWSSDSFINSSDQAQYDGHTLNVNDGVLLALLQVSDNPGAITALHAPNGIVSDVTPSEVNIGGGNAYTVGNNDGGGVTIVGGAGNGSGNGGAVEIGGGQEGGSGLKGTVYMTGGDLSAEFDDDIVLTGAGVTITSETSQGIVFNGGVSSGTAIQHKRCTIVSLGAGASGTCSITWDTVFADSNYTVTVSAASSDIGYSGVTAKSSTAITVKVTNPTAGALTYTVSAIAIHD